MNNITTLRLQKVNNHQKNYGRLDTLGVSHNEDEYLNFTRKSKQLKEDIILKLQTDFMFEKGFKNFLFVASGHEQLERFSSLPFNNIICVDYQIEEYMCIKISDNKRIYAIPTDAITAFSILKEVGVIIDVLCDNNSGENLGFGSGYSLSSQLVLTSGLSVFNPSKLIVIASKQYQKNNSNYLVAKYFYELGYSKKTELKTENLSDYGLDFGENLLTLYPQSSAPLNYFLLEKRENSVEKIFDFKGKKIHLIQGNLFDRIDDFDISFLIFRSKYQYTHFRNNYSNIVDARGLYSIQNEIFDLNLDEDLTRLVQKLGSKFIAFIPQNNPQKDWIELLEKLVFNTILTDIYFFHINKDDFKQLYRLFEQKGSSNS